MASVQQVGCRGAGCERERTVGLLGWVEQVGGRGGRSAGCQGPQVAAPGTVAAVELNDCCRSCNETCMGCPLPCWPPPILLLPLPLLQAVKDADCLLAIVDASRQPREALAMIQPGADWKGPPMAVVRACVRPSWQLRLRPLLSATGREAMPAFDMLHSPQHTILCTVLPRPLCLQLLNKTDLLEERELAELSAWFQQHCNAQAVLPISALEGDNLPAVVDWLTSQLPESPSMYPKVGGWVDAGVRVAVSWCGGAGLSNASNGLCGFLACWHAAPPTRPHVPQRFANHIPPAGHCERVPGALLCV